MIKIFNINNKDIHIYHALDLIFDDITDQNGLSFKLTFTMCGTISSAILIPNSLLSLSSKNKNGIKRDNHKSKPLFTNSVLSSSVRHWKYFESNNVI